MPVMFISPEEVAKSTRAAKALKRNVAQMRTAFAAWKVTKSNAQPEPLLIEMVESIDSMYVLLKRNNPDQIL